MDTFVPGLGESILSLTESLRGLLYVICVAGFMLHVQRGRNDPESPGPPNGMAPDAPVVGRFQFRIPARISFLTRAQSAASSLINPPARPNFVALAMSSACAKSGAR